jgi:protein-disulfide isomerase
MSPLQPTEQDHVIGGDDRAAITLVVYGDYQCPYTARSVLLVAQLLDRLGDRLRYVFRNFPLLDMHPDALAAARAAEAADRQGRFWDMHALLFGHQQALDELALHRHAAQLGLDEAQFARDFADAGCERRVLADRAGGEALGVGSTPTFFVNGMKYDGPVDGIVPLVEDVATAASPTMGP